MKWLTLAFAFAMTGCVVEDPSAATLEAGLKQALQRADPADELRYVTRLDYQGRPAACGISAKAGLLLYHDGRLQVLATNPLNSASQPLWERCGGRVTGPLPT